MSKRNETLQIENALTEECRQKRLYGCEEVTIGFPHQGKGNEIVDFISMDSKGIICCYEIKVSLVDLKSKAKKSFYGHYNYLVVSSELLNKVSDWGEYIPNYVGLMVCRGNLKYHYLESISKAKRMDVSANVIDILKDSMIRSMYFKKEKYRDANNLKLQSELKSESRRFEKLYREQLKRAEDYYVLIRRFLYLIKKLTGQKFYLEDMITELERKVAGLEHNKVSKCSVKEKEKKELVEKGTGLSGDDKLVSADVSEMWLDEILSLG